MTDTTLADFRRTIEGLISEALDVKGEDFVVYREVDGRKKKVLAAVPLPLRGGVSIITSSRHGLIPTDVSFDEVRKIRKVLKNVLAEAEAEGYKDAE